MQSGFKVVVHPGTASLNQSLSEQAIHSPGGMNLSAPTYTVDSLLDTLLDEVETAQARISPLAGAIMVRQILNQPKFKSGIYRGVATAWRLPQSLWGLLLEIKSAGLNSEKLLKAADNQNPKLQAIAELLGDYQKTLNSLELVDRADLLGILEEQLKSGHKPNLISGWAELELHQVLWLRGMDIRLIRMLARVLPVRLNFAAPAEAQARPEFHGLLSNTARMLEADDQADLEISWGMADDFRGACAPLALSCMGVPEDAPEASGLEINRSTGRYGECEAMLLKVRELLEQGVAPGDILISFPDLSVSGQMLCDVAQRLKIPLDFASPESLISAPLVCDFLRLIGLPQADYPRQELGAVLDSLYLRPALASLHGWNLRGSASQLLLKAEYVDSLETPVRDQLALAAQRSGNKEDLQSLAEACGHLVAWLSDGFYPKASLIEHCQALESLLSKLNLARYMLKPGTVGDPNQAARLWVRDLWAWRGLQDAVQSLSRAAKQAGADYSISGRGLLALLKEALRSVNQAGPGRTLGGIKVLPLDQAFGLTPKWLLVGGLNQGEFPNKPKNHNFISSQDRLKLGQAAGSPVWRTDQEDSGGQTYRLLHLMASSADGVWLSCQSADMKGSEKHPALILSRLAGLLGLDELPKSQGSVFGQLPELDNCFEPLQLWAAAAKALHGPGKDQSLGRAVLEELSRGQDQAQRWQLINHGVELEKARPSDEADVFSGSILATGAANLLKLIMHSPQRRSLSASSLEHFTACPMSWFYSAIMRLAPDDAPDWGISPSLEGDWVHKTLELFFNPGDWHKLQDEPSEERLKACLAKAREKYGNRQGLNLVWQAKQSRLQRTLTRVVEREIEDMAGLQPLNVELELGQGQGLELATQEGPILLKGRIDRLDGSGHALRVVDYKHTGNEATLRNAIRQDEFGQSVFQLPVYWLEALNHCKDGCGLLAGRFLSTKKPFFIPRSAETAADSDFLQNLPGEIADIYVQMCGGDYRPMPDKATCAYCGLKGVCRADSLVEV